MDIQLLEWIQSNLRCGVLDAAMPLITRLGDGGMIWIGCSLVMLLIPKTRKAGAAIAAALAVEVICCNLCLKPLVARVRPCDVSAAGLLIPRPTDYSFPSGHAGAAFASASALFFSNNRLWIPAAALSVLIGFSRLYLYVHYPSDVIAGALLGIMAGWAGERLARVIEGKLHERKTAP